MGRKRKNNSLGLPSRVYLKHGAFDYAHPSGKWERIGTDTAEAKKIGNLYNDPENEYGTVAYWLGMFLQDCKARVGLPKSRRGLAQRTYDDYDKAAENLKAFFGRMIPSQVEGHHVAEYLDIGAKTDRAVRANREKACLSACFSWMRRKAETGVKLNPCLGIARNPEKKRERYVEHDEYELMLCHVAKPVRALMELVYRTLQRPEDIVEWGPSNIVRKREPDGTERRVLRTRQGKTDVTVDILLSPDIEAVLDDLQPPGAALGPGSTFLRTRKGKPYTYSGLSSMFRRRVAEAVAKGLLSEPFAMYDLKGKGATDMWLSGVPLTFIQVLCGHESVTTTERYVKARWRGTVIPNATKMPSNKRPSTQ